MLRYYVLIATALCTLVGCEPQQPSTTPTQCEIWLGGAIDKSIGIAKPYPDEPWPDRVCVDTPANVTVWFPSGGKLSVFSRVSFLRQNGGMVRRVKLTPVREIVPFSEAVKTLDAIGKDLKISKNECFRTRITEWRNTEPVADPFQTFTLGCDVDDEVELFAEISSPPANGGLDYGEGWILSVTRYDRQYYAKVIEHRERPPSRAEE